MNRAITGTILVTCAGWLAFGQAPETQPRFEIADVHVSAKTTNQSYPAGLVRGGRYEVKAATMVDLIKIAYGFDTDKILGGPNWLELDRFDVIAKAPADSTADTQKAKLQALLEDRFKLVVHKDTKPLPAYALTVGKKPQLKEAAGSEQTGCKLQSDSGAPAEGGRIMFRSPDGITTTISLGPGMTIRYQCRNITMAAFAAGLPGMMTTSLGSRQVSDETELKGSWDFDLRYSLRIGGPMMANQGDRISIFDAVDKQLGLKLEEKPIPTPVIVVDSVNRKPSENPPGVAEALSSIPAPTEFEVASMKPADPDSRNMRIQTQPGGRLTIEAMPLRFLVNRAFSTNTNDQVVGLPKFAETDRYDIVAKAPSEAASASQMDMETMAPMIRALLVDRCKMAYHTEDRPVTASSLVAAKPKMKKADPDSRIFCRSAGAPVGAPPGSRVMTCQNITMAQFADRLHGTAPELNWPVLDATGIEGGWDFALTFSFGSMTMAARQVGEPGQAAADVPSASVPSGGYTVFEAVEKQLGLKLEKRKRTMPVIVIDHFEKPAEN
jgi:uncharacterized protein (TIGR03435 family)